MAAAFYAPNAALAIDPVRYDGTASAPVKTTIPGSAYMIFDHWGGIPADAEKRPDTAQDDSMCWAAAAANVLEWTGLGLIDEITNTDRIFKYFQDHWTNDSGMMEFAWEWWFDGTNESQGEPWISEGWAQVDVPVGGFYPSQSFDDYYRHSSDPSLAMSAIDKDLHDGYAVALGVYPAPTADGHALTCWGFNYDPDYQPGHEDYYLGIWVTDSDDSRHLHDPPDLLQFYPLQYDCAPQRWLLQDFYGTNNWYIGDVQSLIPEPTTATLLTLGILAFLTRPRQ